MVFILFLISESAGSEAQVLSEVRSLFLLSGKSEASCTKLMSMLEQYNETNNPVLGAYHACATMMMAGYVFNPFTKLSYFNKGKELLEKCINSDSINIELHYLRFAMQSEAPSFLGYKEFISADKKFIMDKLGSVKDDQLREMIVSFLIKSSRLTEKEKKQLSHE